MMHYMICTRMSHDCHPPYREWSICSVTAIVSRQTKDVERCRLPRHRNPGGRCCVTGRLIPAVRRDRPTRVGDTQCHPIEGVQACALTLCPEAYFPTTSCPITQTYREG